MASRNPIASPSNEPTRIRNSYLSKMQPLHDHLRSQASTNILDALAWANNYILRSEATPYIDRQHYLAATDMFATMVWGADAWIERVEHCQSQPLSLTPQEYAVKTDLGGNAALYKGLCLLEDVIDRLKGEDAGLGAILEGCKCVYISGERLLRREELGLLSGNRHD
ncbi:hypothetical protein LTR37_005807 [Vermiconidia calcicola]|uniref:Uncharacterized protein n=1 Tax=Vermiconidia calcicola TaxID=1690605 RepID=A0ACC3NI12_9PEZI|nr:hypothetical protein LTR37_005807 [Vermiconidia calcicola]